MRTRELTGALLVVGLLALGGCAAPGDGSGAATGGDSGASPGGDSTVLFGDCRADAPVLEQAAALAEVDLDGSGTPSEVRWVPADSTSPCRNALVSTVNGEMSAQSLGESTLEPGSARVVQLAGTDRQLLLLRADPHPRGGYDLRLFGADGAGLGEVLYEGHPLLGTVATDGGAAPATATCTPDGGIALLEARTHKPPGIVLAWDVYRTTYALDGLAARRTGEEQVYDGIADPTLREKLPQMFDTDGHLQDCTPPS